MSLFTVLIIFIITSGILICLWILLLIVGTPQKLIRRNRAGCNWKTRTGSGTAPAPQTVLVPVPSPVSWFLNASALRVFWRLQRVTAAPSAHLKVFSFGNCPKGGGAFLNMWPVIFYQSKPNARHFWEWMILNGLIKQYWKEALWQARESCS